MAEPSPPKSPSAPSPCRPRRRPHGRRRVRARGPALYFNRELSWLDFNDRVLQLAEDPSVPLLERMKFAAIFTSNLDEFFMIRVAGVHDQVDAGLDDPARRRPDADRDPRRDPRARSWGSSSRQPRCVEHDLRPALAEHGIRIVPLERSTDAERRRSPSASGARSSRC